MAGPEHPGSPELPQIESFNAREYCRYDGTSPVPADAHWMAVIALGVANDVSPTPAVPQHPDATARQVAPEIAAALLTKPRAELTVRQAEVVDVMKVGCPGYVEMRSLMLAFRSTLRDRHNPLSGARG